MLNTDIKDKAVNALKKSAETYNDSLAQVKSEFESLFNLRSSASVTLIVSVESYINRLAHTPKEFSKDFAEIRAEFSSFNHYVADLQKDAKRADFTAGGTAGAGVMMGAGVAALGPTAAIAVATTFGAASTGTAIATLSGAAASNAALAWLGGGALVAGGGGMAAGEALLLLAGPVGWGIGAVAILGGGLWYRGQNEKIAKQANIRSIELEGYKRERQAMALAIKKLASLTRAEMDGIKNLLSTLSESKILDYLQFDSSQKDRLQALVNIVDPRFQTVN